jgi:hypothetical protein
MQRGVVEGSATQESVALITQEQKLVSLLCQRARLWKDPYSLTDVAQLSFFVESIEIAGEPDEEVRKGGLRLEHA